MTITKESLFIVTLREIGRITKFANIHLGRVKVDYFGVGWKRLT